MNSKALVAKLSFICIAVSSLFSVYMVMALFQEGYPSSWDGGAHFVRLKALNELFLPKGYFSGWSFHWYNGLDPFLFYPNLYFTLVAFSHNAINALPFVSVELLTSYKASIVIGYVLLPLFLYLSSRILNLSRLVGVVAAVVAPGISAIHGIGIEGMFHSGLIPQVFTLPFFILALSAYIRAFETQGVYIFFAGVLFGLVSSLHLISGLALAVVAIVHFIFLLGQKTDISVFTASKIFLFIAFSSFLIASSHILPIVIHWDLRGPGAGWGDFPVFAHIVKGELLAGKFSNCLALLFVVLPKRTITEKSLVVIGVFLFLLFLGAFQTEVSSVDRILNGALKFRFIPYFGLILALMAGLTVERLIDGISNLLPKTREGWKTVLRAALISLAVLGLALDSYFRIQPKRSGHRVDSHYQNIEKERYLSIYEFLKDFSPYNSIIAYDDRGKDFGDPGYNQMASRVVLETGRFTLLGNQIEATRSHNGDVLINLHLERPDEIHKRLSRYSVNYIFAWHEDVRKNLAGSDLFQEVYRKDDASIWKLKGVKPYFISLPSEKVAKFEFSHEYLRWKLSSVYESAITTFAVSYHPYWQLYANGQKSELWRSSDNLLETKIKQGTNEIFLSYERPLWNRLLFYLSTCSFLVMTLFTTRSSLRCVYRRVE